MKAKNTLPPWGHMLPGFVSNVCPPRIPTDFRLRSDEDPKDRLRIWTDWRNETLILINRLLWPRYDYDTGEWVGESIRTMEPLTETDLDVTAEFQSAREGLEFERPVRSPLRAADCPVQDDIFDVEDRDNFAKVYASYDRTLSNEIPTTSLQELHNQGMLRKVSSVASQFKFFLQRPRPYQTSLLFERPQYRYLDATSAHTPSICSGHCLQNLLAVGGILESWLVDGVFDRLKFPDKSSLALQQWAVDIGDRRVLAGVHYPSDNIASWFIFLRLADRVFVRPEVKQRLWGAIQHQSYVYGRIFAAASEDKSGVYRTMLDELKRAATEDSFGGDAAGAI